MGIMPPGATVVPRKDSEMNATKQTARLAGLAYLLNGVGSALGRVHSLGATRCRGHRKDCGD